jgi:hypothetical protein
VGSWLPHGDGAWDDQGVWVSGPMVHCRANRWCTAGLRAELLSWSCLPAYALYFFPCGLIPVPLSAAIQLCLALMPCMLPAEGGEAEEEA